MKILIIDDEVAIRETVSFLLDSHFPNLQTLEAGSGNEGIELIKTHPDLSCIVCDYSMPNGNGDTVYRYLLEQKLNIPYVLCSSYPAEKFEIFNKHKPYGSVVKPEIFPALNETLAPLLSANGAPKFIRIQTGTVLKYGLLSCDLYIKFNEEKYLKVMREGDLFDHNDFSRFNSKKIDFLYVKATDAAQVIKRMIEGIRALLQAKIPTTFEQNLVISTTALELIADFNESLGITSEVQHLIQESTTFAVQTIRRNPKLATLFQQLTLDPESYLASHSILLSHVSCGIASLLNWPSDTTFNKLALAALLHDLTLKYDDLARIDSLQEFEANEARFTPEQKKLYWGHPQAASELANSLSDLLPDVDSIIYQHHELPDGSGFPNKLSHHQISPLAAAFIVAQKMIAYREKNREKPSIVDFLNSLPHSFRFGHFRNVTDAITDSVVGQI